MRGSLGLRLASSNGSKQTLISSSAFSTFSGGSGRGRGRGRDSDDSGPPKPQFTARPPGKSDGDEESIDAFSRSGVGHGRGKPIPSSPILPSFSSWMSAASKPSAGRGRTTSASQSDSHSPDSQGNQPKKPIFFLRQDDEDSKQDSPQKTQFRDSSPSPGGQGQPSDLLNSILTRLPGAGRGKPIKSMVQDDRPSEENRHLRPRPGGMETRRGGGVIGSPQRSSQSPPSQRLSREEAVKKAVGILSRGGGGGGGGGDRMEEGGRGRGFRGRGVGGRGGRGMQGWRGRGGRGGGSFQDKDEDFATGLYLGDNADGETLAKRIGVENMDKLVEGFEEMSGTVLPSPMDDAYVDALHTNYLIEFEEEYLMEEFGTNPDIDEKPPIPLRDALEKMKPFLMAYEGIQSQEEWEEIMKETMEKVPYLKELVDHYSGPERVTAKQQQQELERVAKTLPQTAPSSVKRFTDRALLSLQSNPGWGFDKKCQFMDKLVWEVSQHYK